MKASLNASEEEIIMGTIIDHPSHLTHYLYIESEDGEDEVNARKGCCRCQWAVDNDWRSPGVRVLSNAPASRSRWQSPVP